MPGAWQGPRIQRNMLRRGAITEFVRVHDFAWEGCLAILALVYLALSFLVDTDHGVAGWVLGLLAAIFLTEFAVRCFDAESRLRYLRAHWLDLVSCIPLVGGLRALRLLRLLRLGAAMRLAALAEHGARRSSGGRQSFWYLGPILVLVWLTAAAAYWSFEHTVNPNVHSFGDALYWALTTATTVGYGDVRPVTPEGRVLAGLLILVGIALVGAVSARLTSRWLAVDDGVASLGAQMTSIEAELARLNQLLATQPSPLDAMPRANGGGEAAEMAAAL